jgi:VanZ family protein
MKLLAWGNQKKLMGHRKKLRRLISLWLPPILWCGLIFYLSSIPNLKAASKPLWDEIIRSSLHFIFYTILYYLFFRAINFGKKAKNYWLPLLITCLYGFSDEVHQLFVPTRTFQLKDILVNFLGATSGMLSLKYGLPKSPPSVKIWAKKLSLVNNQ